MNDIDHDRRRFTRVTLDIPTEVHQGGSVWQVELIHISLNGIAVTQPEDWDADYSHPFNFILQLDDGGTFEVFAHLIHIEAGTLGFQLEHLGVEQIAPLAKLLARTLNDDELVEAELRRLDEINS